MIFEIIMYGITVVITYLGSFLPGYGQVPLLLPWGLDNIVTQGVMGYRILAQSFPPFTVVLNAFIIYLGFRIALQILKVVPILGKSIR
jgi:hypothetical protein